MTSPEFYGAGMWRFIHSAAGNAVEQHKRDAFVKWLRMTPPMFPCDKCGNHLAEGLRRYPPEQYADSAERLLKLTFILHDEANNHWNNDNPGKPRKCSPPWQEVKDLFLSLPEEDDEPVAAAAPIRRPAHNNQGTRMYVSQPVFQQFKRSFYNY